MSVYDKYEAVIGLEVHAQLLTQTKAYSNDKNEYGAKPNTLTSAVSLGHPGTLPVMNKKVIELATKMGIAMNCTINYYNEFARKNYFYADLPKGYQITQWLTPICTKGSISIETSEGEKSIGITRIHMEEDAGKSMHDIDPYHSLVDLNRAGVPLIEIVTEPDLRTSEDAYAYLTEVRKLVRYLDICDGNMEEGSLRCDANVSVRLKGAKKFGTKVEVKNMNSIRNVKRAIEHEIKRQIDLIESGEAVKEQTRGFNALDGTTSAQRSKEQDNDYRYFPEPDLPPVVITDEYIKQQKAAMPALPKALQAKYVSELGLSDYDAKIITDDKGTAQYFEALIELTNNYKSAANWIIGPIKSYLNEKAIEIEAFPLSAEQIQQLIELIDTDKLNFSSASQRLFPELLNQPEANAAELAEKLNLIQSNDSDFLLELVKAAMDKFPDKVEAYKAGNKNLLGLFMGEVMRNSKGKADPKATSTLLRAQLEQ